MNTRIGVGLFVLLALSAGQRAQAVIIPYPDMNGTDVMFLDIFENTFTEPDALFGSPSVRGNRLDFNPLNFTAAASASTGQAFTEIVNGALNFTVMSNDSSFPLERIIIDEAGDYALVGLGNATAMASVTAPVEWLITHVNGSPLADPLGGITNMVFTPAGPYSLPDRGGSWDGLAEIDLVAELNAANVAGNATKVEVRMLNTLTATAGDGGSAFIAKKEVGGLAIIVPETTTLAPFLLCLLPLLGRLRRR